MIDAITCTPGVQGGEPCVKGTRTPVRSIVVLYGLYHQDRAAVQAGLPHLTTDQVDAALDYYRHHTAEIDELIESQRRALLELGPGNR